MASVGVEMISAASLDDISANVTFSLRFLLDLPVLLAFFTVHACVGTKEGGTF